MAICANAAHLQRRQEWVFVIPLGLASVILPGNDMDVAGLSQRPPPRPPKI